MYKRRATLSNLIFKKIHVGPKGGAKKNALALWQAFQTI